MKCGILHCSTRLFLGCAVTDTEASHCAVKTNQLPTSRHEETLSPEELLAKKVLLTCVRDPITMTDLSNHVTALRGAAKRAERLALFKFWHSKGLGSISETRRRGDGDGHCQAFHRCGLSPDARRFLQSLQVPLSVGRLAHKPCKRRLASCSPGNARRWQPSQGQCLDTAAWCRATLRARRWQACAARTSRGCCATSKEEGPAFCRPGDWKARAVQAHTEGLLQALLTLLLLIFYACRV